MNYKIRKRLSNSRMVILGALAIETLPWNQLKIEFYGPVRAKSSSQRSFNTQLKELKGLELIATNDQGLYELTDLGREVYKTFKHEFKDPISDARKLFESQGGN